MIKNSIMAKHKNCHAVTNWNLIDNSNHIKNFKLVNKSIQKEKKFNHNVTNHRRDSPIRAKPHKSKTLNAQEKNPAA